MRVSNDSMTVASVEAPISMGASFSTDAIWLQNIINYSIQIVWTGTPDGTFTLQASNDLGVKVGNEWDGSGVTNWTTITGSDASTGGSAGNWLYDVENIGYRWVRVVYTRTASTGSMTSIRFNAKGL